MILYRKTRSTNPSGNGNNTPNYVGAIHTTGIPYVFDNLRFKDLPWTDFDRKLALMLSTYWSNFAKTGDPNGAGLPPWPAYNPNDEQWLNIGDEIRMEGTPRRAEPALTPGVTQSARA